MENLKVAIIGGGQVAETTHIPAYRDKEGIQIVSVVSRRYESAQAFAKKNNIPTYYTNVTDMLQAEKPDIVSVCTPNKYHYQHVREALEHHCHVICEKPPTISADDAIKLSQLAKEKNLVLAYNFQHRFAPETNLLHQKMEEEILGDVYYTKISAVRRSGVPGWGHFTNKELQGGGPLIDIGIHMVDCALFLLKFPTIYRVTAKMFSKIAPFKSEGSFGKWDPNKYEVEDSLFAFIELENGGLIELETSFALHIKPKSYLNVSFSGDKAGASLYPLEIYTDRAGELVTLYEYENTTNEDAKKKSIHSFIDHCTGKGNNSIVTGDEGYKVQTLIEALYRSAETGESVYL
ncbi:oxidoreductase [Bacillus sp. J14TS2]|uniref:Gfo/Idh/MocA family protein n=1 Tax=Bacillus sp. J14TS2 TaxID=2807188 RepID=UPI001B2832DA|nr:Gfo/Idh/MocA family oxidoreductase [Bacillus sp. J14TS2]GIN71469.1 oxidoreductase [Bacillus sp. J14TS2]